MGGLGSPSGAMGYNEQGADKVLEQIWFGNIYFSENELNVDR